MVCKVEVCQWFRYMRTFERLDLLCKLLHLCSAHELRFISAVVEDHARRDYTTLRESATKVNDVSTLRKLRPNLFSASDRSTLIVYLSLLESSNVVCSHVLFEMLDQIEAQLVRHFLARKECAQVLDDVVAHDVMLMYTMAAYHPAFTISQRLQLSDYLEKAQTYLAGYFTKSESDDVEGQIRSSESKSSSSSCVSSPHNVAAKSALSGIVKPRVHVKRTELASSQWDRVGHNHAFQIQVTWSNGEVREISRSYQELHTFHVELIRLFPKYSGAHRKERQIPYLPQEKKSSGTSAAREFEEHINRYIKQLSALPDHMLECEHITNFFRVREDSATRENQQESNSMFCPLQTVEGVDATILDESASADELSRHLCNLTIPTAHAPTTVLQQRYSYSSVVASPLTHHSPIPSPLSSPHVSPPQHGGISTIPMTSTSTSSTADTIAQWLKNLRLHKYAVSLSKYSWQQLAQLDDKVLDKEGLTDGAKKKFRKQLNVQLSKLVAKNGIVSPVKVLEPSRSDGGHSCSGSSSSPVPCGPQLDVASRDSPLHPVHHPLSVVTKLGYPASITNSSICSTNSIGSSSPAYSDYSGVSPPTSPRGHHWAHNPEPVFNNQPHVGIPAEFIGRGPIHTVGSPILESSGRLLPTVGSPGVESVSRGSGRRPVGLNETSSHTAVPESLALSMQSEQGDDKRNTDSTIGASESTAADGPPATAAFIEALHSAQMENPVSVLSPDTIDGRFPRANPYMITGGSQLQLEGDSSTPGIIPINPRIPGVPPIRPPMQGAKASYMTGLLPSPPAVGSNLPPGVRTPLLTSNGHIESPNAVHSIKSQEPGLGGLDVGGKMPLGYPTGLLPRAPSLMGPAPGSHILQRPSNLGVHIPINTSTYSVAPHLLPTPTTAAGMFDKGSPILFPPINVPPPALTPTSMDVDTFNVYHNSNSVLSFNGVPITSSSLISPATSLVSSVSAGPSTQQPLINSPTIAVTRVTTPVTQGASNSSGSNSVSPVSMCQCNCPHCQGDPSQSGTQHQQPAPPSHSLPATHHIPYPPPHMSWSPSGAMFTGGFPIPGGFLSTSANGLSGSMPHYTTFSPHLPPGAYSLPSNMTPDAAAAFIEARNYAIFQAAAQGIPLQHVPPFHYPVNHGIYPVPQLSNSHKNIMCYNCGGAGHMAYECKGPTMENIARTGQFHLNLQGTRSEAD